MNGNGDYSVLKKWHVYAVIFTVALTCGKVVFFSGEASAHYDEQISQIKARLDQDDQNFERKDVIELRMAGIERSTQRIEEVLDKQATALEEIRIKVQAGGRR